MSIQELELAEKRNFYDIINPPKKGKRKIDTKEFDEACLSEISKKPLIRHVKNEMSEEEVDYISKSFFQNGNFYTDGLLKSDILNATLSLNIPLNKYVLVKYNETKDRQKISNEDKKIYLLHKEIPNIYMEGFVFYNLKENSFVFENVNVNCYELSKLEKKIQNYKDFSPSMFSMKPPLDLIPSLENSEDFLCDKKLQLGEKYGTLRMIPEFGPKKCKEANKNEIFSFKDKRFNSFLKDNMSVEKVELIKRVQYVNSPSFKDWCFIDDKISEDPTVKVLQEKLKEKKCIYWDAEYTSKKQYLHGFYHEEGTYEYIWEDDNEERLCQKVFDFFQKYSDYAFIYYVADKSKFEKLLEKMKVSYPKNFFDLTIDLFPIIKNYCAFKGAYNFSIKSIEKVFTKKGLITETYEDGNCKNGLDSIFIFHEYLKTKDERIKQDIIEYNRLDCQNQKIILNKLLTLK